MGGSNLYQTEASNPSVALDPFGMLPRIVVGANRYGTWTVSPNPQSRTPTRKDAGAGMAITFQPNNACDCNEIAYLQLVRVTYMDTGAIKPVFPNRQTRGGWAVDRNGPFVLGWYGYDDPTAEHSGGVPTPSIIRGDTTANPVQPAIMTDTPNSPDKVALVYSYQAYAICKTGRQAGLIYGTLLWDFTVDTSGQVTIPNARLAPPTRDLGPAVDLWNRETPAPGDPKHQPLGPFREN